MLSILFTFDTLINSRAYNNEQQQKAEKLTFEVYDFSKLPSFLNGKDKSVSVFELSKPINPETSTTEVLSDKKYTHLIHYYGKVGSSAQIKQFNKQSFTIIDHCKPNDPEFPNSRITSECVEIGKNNLGEGIYKTTGSLKSVVYVTDVQDTRISLSDLELAGVTNSPDAQVIELFNSLEKKQVSELHFKNR